MERIAFFLPDMDAGGAQRAVMRLAAYLVAERNVDVDLVVNRAEGALAAECPAGVHLHVLGTARIRYAIPRLLRYLRERRPDALLCTLLGCIWTGVIAGRFSRTGTRVVIRQANSFGRDFRAESENQKLSGRLGSRSLPWLLRFADSVIAVSDDVARQVVATGVPSERVQSIANPVSTAELRERAAVPVEHSWLADDAVEPVIVAAGRLCRQKGFDVLIEAVARANETSPVRCIILGEGPLRSTLEAHARDRGVVDRVDMPGVAENPFAYFRAATAVALSSRWEGMPNVLLEALAIGAPVVTTDCPGGSRQVVDAVGAGLLVAPDDPEALARGILRVIDRPTDYAADPAAVESAYGFAAVADRYLGVLLGAPAEPAAAA